MSQGNPILTLQDFTSMRIPSTQDWIAIAASSFVTFVTSSLYYGYFFAEIFERLTREDKGLTEKTFEESIKKRWPYPMSYSILSSAFCQVTRAFFFWHWFLVLGLTRADMQTGLSLAVCWFIGVHCVSAHHYFWQGRRFAHVMLDYGNELCSCVLGAAVVLGVM